MRTSLGASAEAYWPERATKDMMILATVAVLSPVAFSPWERPNNLRNSVAQRVMERRAYRTALAELDASSDRDLSDLGLARADVPRVALEAAQA